MTDDVPLDLNQRSPAQMHGGVKLAALPGAGHLFEKPALDRVSDLAGDWFRRYQAAGQPASSIRP